VASDRWCGASVPRFPQHPHGAFLLLTSFGSGLGAMEPAITSIVNTCVHGGNCQALIELWTIRSHLKSETANRVRGRIETIIAKNVDVDDKD
jgi:hypothetical protein